MNAEAEGSVPSVRRREQRALSAARRTEFVQRVEQRYALDHLHEVSGRPPLGQYFKRLWQRRHFIWWESKSKVETENIGNRLGSFWFILRPCLDAAFYWLVFGVVLEMSRGVDNYTAFVIIGVFMFQLTSSAVNNGVNLIKSSKSTIRAFQFPRASLAVASLVHNFLQRIPAIIAMFVIIVALPPHALPQVTWLLFPAILALQTIMDFGLYLLFARLGHLMPDLAKAMSFFSRILLYGSGVIFPLVSRLEDRPEILAIIEFSPVYQVLMMYRTALIDGAVPSAYQWILLSAWAIGLLLVGFFFFWRGEESYGREQQ